MTFGAWLKGNSGFRNFSREELYAEVDLQTMESLIEELKYVWQEAYKYGRQSAYDDMGKPR